MSATAPSPDQPVDVGFAAADIIVGLYAALAILASIENRSRTGKGQYIDISAYEAVVSLLGPALIKTHSRIFRGKQDPNGHSAAPYGCYPCRGKDRWCAIAVFTEREWRLFREITGIEGLKSPRFLSPAARRKNRERLDGLIAEWTTLHHAESVERRLQKAGIAAAMVQNAQDLGQDPQLKFRRFFVPLPHAKSGSRFTDRSALWPWNEKTSHWRPAPEMGADNHYVFSTLLGHSETELREWIERGVLS
jgi:crotonobetainyl-CoA:carnitine CoA-transferase CaiB-like acyl-CoA transferase